MTTQTLESIYGIYYGRTCEGYHMPDGERQAGCIIHENQSHEDIIRNMCAADFLNCYTEYTVIDHGPSIHIYYKFSDREGGLALVLVYEEDL